MITSDKRNNIDRQQLEIAINTRPAAGTRIDGIPILGYDPTLPPDIDTNPQIIAPNFIDNSDFDFSKDGYLNNPTVGGDAAEECYNWYRQRFIKVIDAVIAGAPSTNVQSASAPFKAAYTYPMDFVLLNGDAGGVALSGTLTRVDDNNATLSTAAQNNIAAGGVLWFGESLAESSANALKATAHSLFAANEGTNTKIPRWDKTNGWVEIGSDTADKFDLACPLMPNFVRGGLTYYFRCIVARRPGTIAAGPIRIGVGIWDATAIEKRFLESSNLDLSGIAVGTAGATSYTYVILADLEDGTTITSDTVTIANGNAALSSSNYNRLTWLNSTGILRVRIYRSVGGVVKRVFTITNGATDYNDYGTDEGETPPSLPTAGVTRAIAYKVSTSFNPSSETAWDAVLVVLTIPSTYDTSRTTGKQWLRITIEGDTGGERMILLDRVMLSLSNGGWQRSARDLQRIANQNPTSLPTETTQGGTGVINCFTLDTLVVVCDADGSNMRSIPIGEVERGMFVFSGGTRVSKVTKIKHGEGDAIFHVRLSNDIQFRCTPSERFITSRADRHGTRIDDLTYGDEILCWNNGRVETAAIEGMVIETDKTEPVRTLSLQGRKTFIAGNSPLAGAIAHNLKLEEGNQF